MTKRYNCERRSIKNKMSISMGIVVKLNIIPTIMSVVIISCVS